MSKYILYFKALKMRKDLSVKTLYSFLLMSTIGVILSNLVFSGLETTSVIGPSFILMIVIFAAGSSQAESLNEPDILMSLPWTVKDRVKYYYIHIFVLFLIAYLIFLALLYMFIGLFWVLSTFFDGIEILNGDSNDLIHYSGDIYSLAITFIQVALYAVIGFIKSIKKRYGWFILSTVIILFIHMVLLSIFEGNLGIYDAYAILNPTGDALYFTIGIFLGSVMMVYGSYRYVWHRHSYRKQN